MRVVHDPAELASSAGGSLVPTMGALHDGHAALVRRAAELARPVVVSIFVNPTQFGPGEDWKRYPRTLDADLGRAATAGADVVFAPDVDAIYPAGRSVVVPRLPPAATRPGLEDACRPGHFAGVCQVVARLFDLARPVVAVFGEKDYQQLLVVRQMVAQEGRRWAGLRIAAHPTVRLASGLAQSSRNVYLQAGDTDRALALYRALQSARRLAVGGAAPGAAEEAMRGELDRSGLTVDYAVVRDGATLEPIQSFANPARALIAARLDAVRLIDNDAIP
jgi:pantoate--beta-alanine ligase